MRPGQELYTSLLVIEPATEVYAPTRKWTCNPLVMERCSNQVTLARASCASLVNAEADLKPVFLLSLSSSPIGKIKLKKGKAV